MFLIAHYCYCYYYYYYDFLRVHQHKTCRLK